MVEFKTVYAIRQKDTGKVYIGSARNLDIRLRGHMSALEGNRHPNEDMQADFNKYGRNSFEFYELDTIPTGAYRDRETYWILVFGTHYRDKGYNYKDLRGSICENITQFPRITEAQIEPITSRDLATCYYKVAKNLGITIDQLMELKVKKQEG